MAAKALEKSQPNCSNLWPMMYIEVEESNMQREELIRKAFFKLVRSEGWQWITFSKIASG